MDESKTAYVGPAGTARVLIVDDEETLQRMLLLLLGNDFRIALVSNGEEALEQLAREPADVVLLDKNLPSMSGLELLKHIKQHQTEIEVIMITGYASLESALEALRLGAYDYLLKPFDDISIVIEKVTRAAEKRELQQERRKLIEQIIASNAELRKAHERLRNGYIETLTSMITALEARDPYTRGHSDRVADLATKIAKKMGIEKPKVAVIHEGALLHDLGKIGIREAILNKRSELTPEEFQHIKTHPIVGSEILGKMESYQHLLPMIRHHHERWDGMGYPDGLQGEQIPLEARVVTVADCFDAMTSERTYRQPMSFKEAIQAVQQLAGSQLDPQVVTAFVEVMEQLQAEDMAC